MLRKLIPVVIASALLVAQTAQACTGIQLTAKDGGVVAARTLEFGVDLESSVLVVPAGTQLNGSLTDGGKGIAYTTKYGLAGANAFGMTAIVDGINDQGLYVGLFYFPGYASYPDQTAENAARGMAPYEYGLWMLGNFASVDEVKANFDKVVLLPVIVPQIKQAPPVHFVVHDKTGKSVVIEPINKSLTLYDNPLGVLTNSPTFDWHITNLRNYVNLTAVNVPPIAVDDIRIPSFGQGSGMHGIPGDFTPPSRFVRAVAYTQSAIPSDTVDQSVLQAFHILNNFDIPLGAVREVDGKVIHAEYTVWTAASDLKNLRWSYKTFEDQTIRTVDLRAALDASRGEIKTISMTSQQPVIDVSTNFK